MLVALITTVLLGLELSSPRREEQRIADALAAKPSGPGIRVEERIRHSNPVSYAGSGERHSGPETQSGGSVKDTRSLTFSSLDGRITTHQTISAGGREAQWDATTNARGGVEEGSQYWAPFR